MDRRWRVWWGAANVRGRGRSAEALAATNAGTGETRGEAASAAAAGGVSGALGSVSDGAAREQVEGGSKEELGEPAGDGPESCSLGRLVS